MSKTKIRFDLIAFGISIGILFLFALTFRAAIQARYVMDEFLWASFAGDIYRGLRPYVDFQFGKTVLGLYPFVTPFLFYDDTASIMRGSRFIGLAIAVGALITTFAVCRQAFRQPDSETPSAGLEDQAVIERFRPLKYIGLWSIFWMLACSTFRENCYQLRVDMAATLFALAGIFLYLKYSGRTGAVLSGVFVGLAFCITQKAAYFVFAFMVAIIATSGDGYRRSLQRLGLFAAGVAASLEVYVLAFGHGGFYQDVIGTTFFDPAIVDVALKKEYPNLKVFYWQMISRNYIFCAISLFGLGYEVRRWTRNDPRRRFFFVFTITMLVLAALHRAPWPYTFVMVVPFLAVYAALAGHVAVEAISKYRYLVYPALLLVLLVIFGQSFLRSEEHLRIPLAIQLRTVAAAEAILGPEDTYYDAIRIIAARRPASRVILQKVALNQLRNAWGRLGWSFIEGIRASKCKLMIYNYRLESLPASFKVFMVDHYVLIGANIFVSGAEVTGPKEVIDLVWPGRYLALKSGDCKNIYIDGKRLLERTSSVKLDAGRHKIGFTGKGTLLLVPEDAGRWVLRHGLRKKLVALFHRIYEQ